MRLATWNVNSIRARLDIALDWLQRRQPDVLCIQETKVVDELFPTEPFAQAGYQATFAGEKAYNGVAILSLEPVSDVRLDFPLQGNAERRLISGVYRGVRIYSAYVPLGRDPQSEHFQVKLQWIDGLGELLAGVAAREGPLAVLGDFNVAPEPRDVYDPEALDGHILYHPVEREAAQRLLDLGLVDAFRAKRPETGLYSWWDYRQGAFRRNLGFRIDHVWASPPLAERVVDAYIDVDERRKPNCSDHAPVVVEFDW